MGAQSGASSFARRRGSRRPRLVPRRQTLCRAVPRTCQQSEGLPQGRARSSGRIARHLPEPTPRLPRGAHIFLRSTYATRTMFRCGAEEGCVCRGPAPGGFSLAGRTGGVWKVGATSEGGSCRPTIWPDLVSQSSDAEENQGPPRLKVQSVLDLLRGMRASSWHSRSCAAHGRLRQSRLRAVLEGCCQVRQRAKQSERQLPPP